MIEFGSIARKATLTIVEADNMRLTAVMSRSIDEARSPAEKRGIPDIIMIGILY